LAFERNGFCRDGADCKYAHGNGELRKGAQQEQKSVALHQGIQLETVDSVPVIMHGLPERALTLASTISAFGVQTPKGTAVEQFLKDNNTWGKENLDMHDYASSVALISFVSTTCSVASEESSSERIVTDMNFLRQSTSSHSPNSFDESSSADNNSIHDISVTRHNVKTTAEQIPGARFEKTKMCKFFVQGVCAKGGACRFAHEKSALQTPPDLFRTRLCASFITNGSCKNGESCRYAHGDDQLRADSIQGVLKTNTASADGTTSKGDNSCLAATRADPHESVLATMQTASTFDASRLKLMVKNTFIHVSVPSSKPALHRRSASADGRLMQGRSQ
jgi:hypothetical protein